MQCSRLLACAVAALLLAGCAGCGGSGGGGASSFVGGQDDFVLYVSWTRDGDKLNGSLTQGQLKDGESVDTSRAALTGTVSGSGVTLDLRQQSGASSTLNGKLDGDALTLEYLRPEEGLVDVQLKDGKAGDFNAALASLQDRAEQSKASAQSDAAETTEKERVEEHASTVQDDVDALKLAIAQSGKGPKGATDLAQVRRDLQRLRDHAQGTERAGKLNICSAAATVQSDLSILESHVTALQRKQTTGSTTAVSVNEAIDKLREDFIDLQSDEARYLPPGAPTQRTVGRAIQQARRKLHKGGSAAKQPPASLNATLVEARSLASRASIRCQTNGG